MRYRKLILYSLALSVVAGCGDGFNGSTSRFNLPPNLAPNIKFPSGIEADTIELIVPTFTRVIWFCGPGDLEVVVGILAANRGSEIETCRGPKRPGFPETSGGATQVQVVGRR